MTKSKKILLYLYLNINIQMRYIKYLFLFLCFISCKETPQPPIDKTLFTSILIDIHTMDAYQSTAANGRYRASDSSSDIERGVLSKYNITKAEFDSCVNYYSMHIVEYASIYEVVLDSLNKRKNKIDVIIAEHRKRDTLSIWPYRDSIDMQNDTLTSLEFDVPFNKIGLYKLELEVKFGGKDKGIKNIITGSAMGKDTLISFDTIKIARDTVWRRYSLIKPISDSIFKNIHFSIMKCSNLDSIKSRDIKLRRIRLFNPIIKSTRLKRSRFEIPDMMDMHKTRR